MSIIGNALGEAAGQTMNQFGSAMIAADARREENEGRWAIEREKMAKDIQLRREEIAERRREADLRWGDGDGSGSSSGKGGSVSAIIAKIVGAKPELYGMNTEIPGKDKFTTATEGDIDATGVGPGAKVEKYDAEGHAKAKQGIVESNIKNLNKVFQPDKYDDLEKGNAQAMLNDLLAQAKAETDPAKREERVKDLNRISIAAGAKERFDVKDGTVIDTATGNTKTTEVGKSEIKKNEGAAAESYADAKKAGTKGVDGMSKTELIQHNTNLRTTMGSLERELKSERALLVDLPKNQRTEKQARIDSLVKELDTVRAEIRATDKKVSSADEKPAADKPKAEAAKAPEAPKDVAKRENGKKYSTPRGEMVWVSDGKQQGWRKP